MFNTVRTIGVAFGCLLLSAATALGADVTVAWDPVSGATGYIVAWGTTAGQYSETRDVSGDTRTTLQNLTLGRLYYVAVQAYGSDGTRSGYSQELTIVPRLPHDPLAAGNLTLGLTSPGSGWFAYRSSGITGSLAWAQQPWAAYNAINGEIHPAAGDVNGDGRADLVLGLGRGSQCWVAVEVADSTQWLQIPSPSYCGVNGDTYPALGDVDGDGRDEIIVGLGSGGGGQVYVFDDAIGGFAPLHTLRVDWQAYVAGDGATHPAAGDVDGDGLDEIVLGLGPGSQGWLQIFDDQNQEYATLGWTQVSWVGYDAANGTTWPAVGDLDTDGKAEIVVGLGVGGGGWLETFDNASMNFVGRHWFQIGWNGYNAADGATHPAIGNVDGDAAPEIVIGLNPFADGGWFVVHDDQSTDFVPIVWDNVGWLAYRQGGGGLFPTMSRDPR